MAFSYTSGQVWLGTVLSEHCIQTAYKLDTLVGDPVTNNSNPSVGSDRKFCFIPTIYTSWLRTGARGHLPPWSLYPDPSWESTHLWNVTRSWIRGKEHSSSQSKLNFTSHGQSNATSSFKIGQVEEITMLSRAGRRTAVFDSQHYNHTDVHWVLMPTE
jgi:hypothetical protein